MKESNGLVGIRMLITRSFPQRPEVLIPDSKGSQPEPPAQPPSPERDASPSKPSPPLVPEPVQPLGTQGHPIDQLLLDADKAWQAQRTQRSKSFKDIVKKYRRQHGRHPPPDFDVVRYIGIAPMNEMKWL